MSYDPDVEMDDVSWLDLSMFCLCIILYLLLLAGLAAVTIYYVLPWSFSYWQGWILPVTGGLAVLVLFFPLFLNPPEKKKQDFFPDFSDEDGGDE